MNALVFLFSFSETIHSVKNKEIYFSNIICVDILIYIKVNNKSLG